MSELSAGILPVPLLPLPLPEKVRDVVPILLELVLGVRRLTSLRLDRPVDDEYEYDSGVRRDDTDRLVPVPVPVLVLVLVGDRDRDRARVVWSGVPDVPVYV